MKYFVPTVSEARRLVPVVQTPSSAYQGGRVVPSQSMQDILSGGLGTDYTRALESLYSAKLPQQAILDDYLKHGGMMSPQMEQGLMGLRRKDYYYEKGLQPKEYSALLTGLAERAEEAGMYLKDRSLRKLEGGP